MNAAPESMDDIRRLLDAQPGPSVDARSAAVHVEGSREHRQLPAVPSWKPAHSLPNRSS